MQTKLFKKVATGVLSAALVLTTAIPAQGALVPTEGKKNVKSMDIVYMDETLTAKSVEKKSTVEVKYPSNAIETVNEEFVVSLDGGEKGVAKGTVVKIGKEKNKVADGETFVVAQPKVGEDAIVAVKAMTKAKTKKGKKLKVPFKVSFVKDPNWITATSLDATIDNDKLVVGDTAQITVKVEPEGAVYAIISSDEKVATVDEKDVVTAVGAGTATLTVLSDSLSKDITVTVADAPAYEPTESIALDAEELFLAEGETATLTATVEPAEGTEPVAWTTSDATVATVADGVVTAVAAGEATITATSGDKSAECAVVVSGDTEAPVVEDAHVEDYMTLCVDFDEDIVEGEGFDVAVKLGETDVDVVTSIEDNKLHIVKADGSSFAAGTYAVTIKGVSDKIGNVAEDITGEITKENSYAVGFNNYEGFVAEYDLEKQANTNRKVHLTVVDQYGEEMDQALAASYGTVTVKASIKSTGSVIGAIFNKKGDTIDDRDMAFVLLTADDDFKSGETLVIDMTNKLSGVEYTSSMEVEIVDYDEVQTAKTVESIAQTTTTTKNVVNENYTDLDNGGNLELSSNNTVFLVADVRDANGDRAQKGKVKFVSSDTSVLKVLSPATGILGESAIVERRYEDDGTYQLGALQDEWVFGVWFEAQKAGEATITAYATGTAKDGKTVEEVAYTYTVTIGEASIDVTDSGIYNGEIGYLPIDNSEGLKANDMTVIVGNTFVEDENGRKTAPPAGYAAAAAQAHPYVATASKTDKDLGLEEGKFYAMIDCTTIVDQQMYVTTVKIDAGQTAKSEEIEVHIRPRVEVDSDKHLASGIFVGASATASQENTAYAIPAADGPADFDKAAYRVGGSKKGQTYYAMIGVINTAGLQISDYAADQIKYAWSDDTVGVAKVNIDSIKDNSDPVKYCAELSINLKSEELIGKLTISVGGADKELDVKIGKAPYVATIEADFKDDGKATLIKNENAGYATGDNDAATDNYYDVADGAGGAGNGAEKNATAHLLTLKLKDQYGTAINSDASTAGTGRYGKFKLRSAAVAGQGTNTQTIGNELTANIDNDATGTYKVRFSNMYEGVHDLVFFVGDNATPDTDDPTVEQEVEFVLAKNVDKIELQSGVDWSDAAFANLTGNYPEATTAKKDDAAKGVNIGKGKLVANVTTIKPSVKAFKKDGTEIAGGVYTWSILDTDLSLTETIKPSSTKPEETEKRAIASSTSTGFLGFTAGTGEITITPTGNTTITGALTNPDGNGDAYGTYGTGTAAGASDVTFANVMDYAAKANLGKEAEISGTIHLSAYFADNAKSTEGYIHVSNKEFKTAVDDVYLAYAADDDKLGVKKDDPVGDTLIAKIGYATGTKVKARALDSVFGATLDSTGTDFMPAGQAATMFAGPDVADVNDGSTQVNNLVTVLVKATASTDKNASLKLNVTDHKQAGTRIITVPLEIIK